MLSNINFLFFTLPFLLVHTKLNLYTCNAWKTSFNIDSMFNLTVCRVFANKKKIWNCLLGALDMWAIVKIYSIFIFARLNFRESFHCQINIITAERECSLKRQRIYDWDVELSFMCVKNKHISKIYSSPLVHHTRFYDVFRKMWWKFHVSQSWVVDFHYPAHIRRRNRSQKSIYDAN